MKTRTRKTEIRIQQLQETLYYTIAERFMLRRIYWLGTSVASLIDRIEKSQLLRSKIALSSENIRKEWSVVKYGSELRGIFEKVGIDFNVTMTDVRINIDTRSL